MHQDTLVMKKGEKEGVSITGIADVEASLGYPSRKSLLELWLEQAPVIDYTAEYEEVDTMVSKDPDWTIESRRLIEAWKIVSSAIRYLMQRGVKEQERILPRILQQVIVTKITPLRT